MPATPNPSATAQEQPRTPPVPKRLSERLRPRALALAVFLLALKSKEFLRRIPAVRRLYYSLVNAAAFDQLFWHDLMLADPVRMGVYIRAIKKHVRPGMVVADLGTGSGVLACLAAQQGARVYAIEHGGIIEKARALAASNGLNNIEFVHKHSRDFQPPEKLDVLIHEQMGMALLDEDMVENLLDARDRMLKPGGKILPGRFRLFLDPVELRADRRLPYLWEQQIEGLDFSCFKPDPPPWQAGAGYDKRALDPLDVGKVLAREQCVLEFDVHALSSPRLPQTLEYTTSLEQGGRLDGFCLYFRAAFDDEIAFLTGPQAPPTCWGTRLLRAEARPVAQGARLHFRMAVPSITNAATWTWEYTVEPPAAGLGQSGAMAEPGMKFSAAEASQDPVTP